MINIDLLATLETICFIMIFDTRTLLLFVGMWSIEVSLIILFILMFISHTEKLGEDDNILKCACKEKKQIMAIVCNWILVFMRVK